VAASKIGDLDTVKETDGFDDGTLDGVIDRLGDGVGLPALEDVIPDGPYDGLVDGITDGPSDGLVDGIPDGPYDGARDKLGDRVGWPGTTDGLLEGEPLG